MINLKSKHWEIKNIETIIFDKDGTFIDLHFFWGKMTELRADEIINHFNLNKDLHKELCLILGYDTQSKKMLSDGITALYSRVKIIEIFKKELLKYKVQATTETLEKIFDDVSSIFYKNMQEYTKPIDSAIKFIKKVHSLNTKLAIVTSDSYESTILTLKHFSWEKYFDVVVGRESTQYTKESGKPTLFALEKLNANPKTTIMIGDTPIDYTSAKNANIDKTILVATGQIDKSELIKTSDFCLETLDELEIF